MPSKSSSQAKMMAGAAHDPKFAKKVGVPMKVAKKFNKADAKSGILRGHKGGRETKAEQASDKKAGKKESAREDTMDAQMTRLTTRKRKG